MLRECLLLLRRGRRNQGGGGVGANAGAGRVATEEAGEIAGEKGHYIASYWALKTERTGERARNADVKNTYPFRDSRVRLPPRAIPSDSGGRATCGAATASADAARSPSMVFFRVSEYRRVASRIPIPLREERASRFAETTVRTKLERKRFRVPIYAEREEAQDQEQASASFLMGYEERKRSEVFK